MFLGKRNSFHWQFAQEIAPVQIRKINLLLKFFFDMFTFNKFIFYKSSINSIQIEILTSQ